MLLQGGSNGSREGGGLSLPSPLTLTTGHDNDISKSLLLRASGRFAFRELS